MSASVNTYHRIPSLMLVPCVKHDVLATCQQVLRRGSSRGAQAGTAEAASIPAAHEDTVDTPKTRIKALLKDGSWATSAGLQQPASAGDFIASPDSSTQLATIRDAAFAGTRGQR